MKFFVKTVLTIFLFVAIFGMCIVPFSFAQTPNGNSYTEELPINQPNPEQDLKLLKKRVETFLIQKKKQEKTPPNGAQMSSSSNIWDVLKVVVPVLSIMGGFLITKRKKGKFSKYLKQVDKVYKVFKEKPRRLEAELYRLKDVIMEDVKKGKIDEGAYAIIEKRIDEHLLKAREEELDERFGGLPSNIRENLTEMLSDGKLTESEYQKMIDVLKNSTITHTDKESLEKMMRKWKEE